MRIVKNAQLHFGGVDISQISFDLQARDEIPKILMGLQHIYCDESLKAQVFAALQKLLPETIDPSRGRPGMELWKILVLGTLKINCDWDYDKLHDIANNHRTLRLMLGHGSWEEPPARYALQTLKDNLRLFTPEVSDQINQIVVKAGHHVVGQPEGGALNGRCDSFVVETDVHYPTDINLLFDAIRKLLVLITVVCGRAGIPGWRQSQYHTRNIKKLFRRAQRLKRSSSNDPKKQAARGQLICDAHAAYCDLVESCLGKIRQTVDLLRDDHLASEAELAEIDTYLTHADRQITQIRRRVLQGDTIPHDEKVFSLFEEHTEWICKGKAGVPQELGLRVCILEDQYGFILTHQVMQGQTDEAVAVPMVKAAQSRFSTLTSCSFDKGFYRPAVRDDLDALLDTVILPKKGRLSNADRERQSSAAFVAGRKQHAAVESGINALENHGLGCCADHGLDGFQRYVALAVVARNLQILGHRLQQKALKQRQSQEKARKTRTRKRLNAAQ